LAGQNAEGEAFCADERKPQPERDAEDWLRSGGSLRRREWIRGKVRKGRRGDPARGVRGGASFAENGLSAGRVVVERSVAVAP